MTASPDRRPRVAAVRLRPRPKPILRRLALRSAVRRPREAALVVAGPMLGAAIITGSAIVGDTMNASIRQSAYTHLGPVDEVVTVRGAGDQRLLLAAFAGASGGEIDGVLGLATIEAAATSTGLHVRAAPRAQVISVDFERARAFGGDPAAPASRARARRSVMPRSRATLRGRSSSSRVAACPFTPTARRSHSSSIASCRGGVSPATGSVRSRRRTTCSSRRARSTSSARPRARSGRRRGSSPCRTAAASSREPPTRTPQPGRCAASPRRRGRCRGLSGGNGGSRPPTTGRVCSMFTAMGSFGVLAGCSCS